MKNFLFLLLMMSGLAVSSSTAQNLPQCDISFELAVANDSLIVLEYGAEVPLLLKITNNGPDLHDSLDYIYYKALGDSQLELLTFLGRDTSTFSFPYVPGGGSILAHPLDFVNSENFTEDTIFSYCFFRVDKEQGGLYQDINATNDTICLRVRYLAGPSSINKTAALQNDYNVFPNPSTGLIFIETKVNNRQATLHYRLFDMQGRLISQGTLAHDTKHPSINVAAYPPGMYLLELQSGGKTSRHKIIRQ